MPKKIVFTYMMIAATVVAILVLFSGCKNDISVVKSLTEEDKAPASTATQMHLYMSELGSVKNELLFKEMLKYEKPEIYTEYPKGVEIVMYDVEGQKETSLTANYAIDYEDRKIREAKYNVVITNFKTGEIIETEHLIWDQNKELIYSNTQIKQTKPDGSVQIGERFESNESFTKYTIFKPVIIQYAEE